MPNNLPSINLAKNKEISSFTKITDWALTIGYIIVIITFIVTAIAFIYRISLDETLAGLRSEIKNKQDKIASLKSDEDKYRNLQDRITLATTLSEKEAKHTQSIMDFEKLIPNQTQIDSLIFNKDKVNMTIGVTSVSPLADFVNSLKSYNGIGSISIDNLESNPSIGLFADITVTLR